MIGEKIDTTFLNSSAADQILAAFDFWKNTHRSVLAIAGESGSGKTHMATALQHALAEKGRQALILHMDDFFKLPPASNHAKRLQDIGHVGPEEVDLYRLNNFISAFKDGATQQMVPLVDYYQNSSSEIEMELNEIQVVIIEGTYAFFLDNTDFHLFMSRDYKQTKELRIARNRGTEAQDEFVDRVLEIEHQLISKSASKADALIDFHFNLKLK
jgi:uridine kinase